MVTSSAAPTDVTTGRRLAALVALLLLLASVAVVVVYLFRNPVVLVSVVVAELVIVPGVWIAITNRAAWRWLGLGLSAIAFVALVVLLVSNRFPLVLVILVVLDFAATFAGRFALRAGAEPQLRPVTAVPDIPRRAVIFMNPKSGGGKVERFGLVAAAEAAGARVVVLEPGMDLREAAAAAVDAGADCLGAAGGDGSQAIVAQMAADHDLPYVCIPAGTRNHLALDLGLDRDDPSRAISALRDGLQTRMDLALVGDQVFVNNVSFGIYAKVVQDDSYRDAKLGTFAASLPALMGPEAAPFDLQYDAPGGDEIDGAQLILVSNNPYRFRGLTSFGTRERIDGGVLGVVAVRIQDTAAAQRLVRLSAAGRVEEFPGWNAWSTPEFEVRTRSGTVEAGVDGEAMVLDSPVCLRSRPGALRVLLPRDRPGPPQAAPQLRLRALPHLFAVLAGRDP